MTARNTGVIYFQNNCTTTHLIVLTHGWGHVYLRADRLVMWPTAVFLLLGIFMYMLYLHCYTAGPKTCTRIKQS